MAWHSKPSQVERQQWQKEKDKKRKKILIPKQTNSEEKVLRKEPIYVAGIKVGEKGYSAIYTIRFEHDHSAIPWTKLVSTFLNEHCFFYTKQIAPNGITYL